MKRAMFLALGTGAVITSAAAIGIGAAGGEARAMERAAYEAALDGAAVSRRAADARCEALEARQRETCGSEASAAEMVRIAQIEADFRRDQPSARALQRARIDARYHVERARCGALAGFKRDRCLIQAHALKGRAMLDAAAPYQMALSP